jgi:amino acid adenylation domain-containing protein
MLAIERFEAQAARTPAAVAVRWGETRLTYAALNESANRLARTLRGRGVSRDTLVGVAMRRSPLLVTALLGVWKAGGAYVPLDPDYPAPRLEFMLRDAAVRVLLTDSASRARVPFPEERTLDLEAQAGCLAREPAENLPPLARPGDLAYVMYTSGSTGRPKGAMIVQRGLANYLDWAIGAYGVRAGDSVPVHSSVSFDLTVTSLFSPLLAGGEVELLPEGPGIEALAEALRRRGGRALVKITPAHLDLLRHALGPGGAGGRTRVLVIGGENLPAESLRFWREHAPQTRLVNEYGPTETVVGCCVYEMQPGDPHHGPVPIGRPIDATRLEIVDGELCIAGAGVARGYLNRPDLTAERFVPDPQAPWARMYRSGDLARVRADGVFEYLGRRDQQVKVRGYRIELGEIENAAAAHPAVDGCAVLAREEAGGERSLVCYLLRRADTPLAAREVREYLAERLPDFMLPARFVVLDAFPLTANGKVDRAALPPPAAEDAALERTLDAPRSPTEAALARLWRELLGLERVGIHENVFDLGARSLVAMQAVVRMRELFSVEVPLRHLFERPTVAALAEVVEGLTWAGAAPPTAAAAGGKREELAL